MRWFRTCLLSAAVGSAGVAAANAQSGVTLSRPQPLNGPGDSNVPAFVLTKPAPPVVRAQMADRCVPCSAPSEEPNVKRAFQTLPDAARPAAPDQPAKADPPDKKLFVIPQPGSTYGQRNAWTGAPDKGSAGACESDRRDMFGGMTPAYRLYASAEYLSWWTKGYHIPLLVTTAPATDPEATRGAIGAGGTMPLFGDSNVTNGQRSGGRFTIGGYLNPCGTCAIEADYFFLARRAENFTVSSNQFPVLARPFFLVNTGTPSRELTATPGTQPGDLASLTGSITVNNHSNFQGADLIGRRTCFTDCKRELGVLAGFRYLDLRDGLEITENVVSNRAIPGTTVFDPGNNIFVSDSFRTHNQFYGGVLGIEGERRLGRWSLTGRIQVGLGDNHESVNILGSQVVTTPAGQRTVFNGGLLALPSNIGTTTQDRFAVVPQVGIKLGFNVTDNIKIFAGYDFLYWSNVLRPGDQIDLTLNGSQIPNAGLIPPSTAVRPIVPFRTTDFWAHGITAGLEVRY